MTTYKIECFNPVVKKYILYWTGLDLVNAKKMMGKPYARHMTRRLTKISEEIIDVRAKDRIRIKK